MSFIKINNNSHSLITTKLDSDWTHVPLVSLFRQHQSLLLFVPNRQKVTAFLFDLMNRLSHVHEECISEI